MARITFHRLAAPTARFQPAIGNPAAAHHASLPLSIA
jgi:hypothetical protein